MQLTTPRKMLLSLTLCALMALSTACIRADMGVSVKDDGSGTITLTQAIDVKAFQDAAKQFGGALGGSTPSSPTDIFSEKDVDTSKLPPGSKVEKFKDGNYEGVRITTPFTKTEDILPTLNKVADAVDDSGGLSSLGGASLGPSSSSSRPGATPTPSRSSSSSSNTAADAFEKFTVEKTSSGWKFDAVAKSIGGADLGDDAMSQALVGMILKDAQVTFSLRLPGKVTSTNADSTKDGEMKWNLPLTSTQPKTMSAVTSGSGTSSGGDDGGFPILVIVGVIVAVAVVGGLYYMSKQKQAGPPPTPPLEPPPAPTA
jgi:hypothetical protein